MLSGIQGPVWPREFPGRSRVSRLVTPLSIRLRDVNGVSSQSLKGRLSRFITTKTTLRIKGKGSEITNGRKERDTVGNLPILSYRPQKHCRKQNTPYPTPETLPTHPFLWYEIFNFTYVKISLGNDKVFV